VLLGRQPHRRPAPPPTPPGARGGGGLYEIVRVICVMTSRNIVFAD
jgi:hypothetical protein